MCHLGNLPVFVQEGGGPAVRTHSYCIVVGNRDAFFFFFCFNGKLYRNPPPPPPKGMCVCLCFLLDSCPFLERKPKSKLKFCA